MAGLLSDLLGFGGSSGGGLSGLLGMGDTASAGTGTGGGGLLGLNLMGIDNSMRLPMALALMGGGSNSQSFTNAANIYGSMAPKIEEKRLAQAEKNKTVEFMRERYPEYAQMIDAGMPVNTAWAALLKDRNSTAGGTEYGLNPQYGVDKDGNPVLIQIGKDGKAVQTQMPGGVTLSKEPIKLDAGTHFVLMDPITRQPIGQVPKENYQEAFDKGQGTAEGKARGEAAVNLPTNTQNVQQTVKQIDELMNHPGLDSIVGNLDQYRGSLLLGPEGRDAKARFDQLKGRAFLEAYGLLKGGGQITEIEGAKAEAAMARMDRSQGEAEFKTALKDFRDAVEAGLMKLQQAAGMGGSAAGGAVDLKSKYGLE
jgi:hypothetical protein